MLKIPSFFLKNVANGSELSFISYLTMSRKNVLIGEDSIINCRFSIDKPEARISIGARCFIGKSHLVSAHKINIADDVVISWGVTITDHDSHSLNWNVRKNDVINWKSNKKDWTDINLAEINIENKVWIGFNAILLKGITIGEGSIIAAGSIVTKNVPPYTLVAGSPARIIKKLDIHKSNTHLTHNHKTT